ncbi:MAG: phage antirepressor KilAC domain-containing protein [Burkholderiales bacterium]|nr:phage antirepressor KilAC domain-containing protein [Burkholderiales bacterium]
MSTSAQRMNEMISVNDPTQLTMSSIEIAELTQKRHDNVMRDIRTMLVELHGEGGILRFEDTHTNPQNKQTYPVFKLPKRETLVLIAGYNITLRAKIIDRWDELENEKKAAPDFHAVLNDPSAMRGLLLSYTEKVLALEEKNKELTADSEALNRIAKAEGSLCITDAAKTLQIRPKNLFTWLQRHGWIYKRIGCAHYCAYQDKLNRGLMEHKSTTVLRSDGTEKVTPQARVTPEGLEKLAKLLPPEITEVAVNG